jgi:hypothetical protein
MILERRSHQSAHEISKEMNDEAAGMCSYLEERDATEAI